MEDLGNSPRVRARLPPLSSCATACQPPFHLHNLLLPGEAVT